MRLPHRPSADPRSGQALLLVSLVVAAVLGAMTLTWQSTEDAAFGVSFSRRFEDLAATQGRAAAQAVALLETGAPPRSPSRYLVHPNGGAGAPVVVEYRRRRSGFGEEGTRWSVTARAATRAEARRLPPLPDTFAGEDEG